MWNEIHTSLEDICRFSQPFRIYCRMKAVHVKQTRSMIAWEVGDVSKIDGDYVVFTKDDLELFGDCGLCITLGKIC